MAQKISELSLINHLGKHHAYIFELPEQMQYVDRAKFGMHPTAILSATRITLTQIISI